MKYSFTIVMSCFLLCIGATTSAYAEITNTSQVQGTLHSNRAVWLKVTMPNGNTSSLVMLEGEMGTVTYQPQSDSAAIRGRGFMPIIQNDGSVLVQVYRLNFQKTAAGGYAIENTAKYVETLNPRPAASGKAAPDNGLVLQIAKSGLKSDVVKAFTAKQKQAVRSRNSRYQATPNTDDKQ